MQGTEDSDAEKGNGNTPVRKNGGPGKKPGTLSGKIEKALSLALNHGLDPKEAYTLAVGKPPTPSTLTGFKHKVAKYSLTTPIMAKLAHSAVKDALQGKGVEVIRTETNLATGEAKEIRELAAIPTATNRLAAAAMVFDRIEPLKGQQAQGSQEFTQVNINIYGNQADRFVTETVTEKAAIDITPADTNHLQDKAN